MLEAKLPAQASLMAPCAHSACPSPAPLPHANQAECRSRSLSTTLCTLILLMPPARISHSHTLPPHLRVQKQVLEYNLRTQRQNSVPPDFPAFVRQGYDMTILADGYTVGGLGLFHLCLIQVILMCWDVMVRAVASCVQGQPQGPRIDQCSAAAAPCLPACALSLPCPSCVQGQP